MESLPRKVMVDLYVKDYLLASVSHGAQLCSSNSFDNSSGVAVLQAEWTVRRVARRAFFLACEHPKLTQNKAVIFIWSLSVDVVMYKRFETQDAKCMCVWVNLHRPENECAAAEMSDRWNQVMSGIKQAQMEKKGEKERDTHAALLTTLPYLSEIKPRFIPRCGLLHVFIKK